MNTPKIEIVYEAPDCGRFRYHFVIDGVPASDGTPSVSWSTSSESCRNRAESRKRTLVINFNRILKAENRAGVKFSYSMAAMMAGISPQAAKIREVVRALFDKKFGSHENIPDCREWVRVGCVSLPIIPDRT